MQSEGLLLVSEWIFWLVQRMKSWILRLVQRYTLGSEKEGRCMQRKGEAIQFLNLVLDENKLSKPETLTGISKIY